MKHALLSLFVFAGAVAIGQSALAASDSKIVQLHVTDAFVPGGFSSETNAFVIEVGMFPNGCYSWAYADTRNLENNTTEIRSYASVRSGMCIQVLVPYHQEVNLGKMTKGSHTIRFVNSDGTYFEQQMQIE